MTGHPDFAALLAEYRRHTKEASAAATMCRGLSSHECASYRDQQIESDREAQRISVAIRDSLQRLVGDVNVDAVTGAMAGPPPYDLGRNS